MQKTFEVQGPVELDVRLTSGDIDVDPTADGRVEVELIAHDEESQRLVDNARIELNPHGHRPTILVDVPQKRGFSISIFGRSGIECRIRCPHDSGLSVRTKSADISTRGTLGGLNVQTASGDLDIDRVSGGVNVKSASSDFSAREVGGGVNIQTASGDIDLSIARGPVNVTSVSGDISIGEAYDNVNANSVQRRPGPRRRHAGRRRRPLRLGRRDDRRPPRLEGVPRLHDGQRRHDIRARADQ